MVALLLVALALGLSNFAASVGIGLSGVSGQARLRVGVVFGLFETGMPVLGLLLGHGLAGHLGHATRWAGAALLIATGCYAVAQAARSRRHRGPGQRPRPVPTTSQLLVTGTALSIDNLAVGFALGTVRVSVAIAVVVIGAVSVGLSLAGLELGGRVGSRAGDHGEVLGGVVLVGVGIAVAAGLL